MKKLIILFAPAILALSLSSCEDWLELKPTNQIIEEDMWTTQADVEAVVATCYNALMGDDIVTRFIAYGELRSDNLAHNKNPHQDLGQGDREMYKSIALSSIIATDGLAAWGPLYTVINYCNFVIRYAPQVTEVDPDYLASEMTANVAEAKAIRALCYFYLIRAFDRVPYVTEPTIDDKTDFFKGQEEQNVVLRGIIEDLEYAAINARSVYPQPQETKYRITRKAAYAMLADVYLWKASGEVYPQDSIDYEKVISYCDKVYDTSSEKPYNVAGDARYSNYAPWDGVTTYASVFESGMSSPSAEVIFALYASKDTSGEQLSDKSSSLIALNRLYGDVSSSNGTRGDLSTTYLVAVNDKYPVATAANANFTALDAPFVVEMNTETGTEDKRYYYAGRELGSSYQVHKYHNSLGLTYYPAWIFYRISDIYLMKAEAQAEKMNCNFKYVTEVDGTETLHFVNYDQQQINALDGDPTTSDSFYKDSVNKALTICQAIFNRANSKATLRTAYKTFCEKDFTKAPDIVSAERRREFIFEGKRWFDLLRIARRDNKRKPATATTAVIAAVKTKLDEGADLIGVRLGRMDALYWPVNKTELDKNPLLVQNQYYKETADDDNFEK